MSCFCERFVVWNGYVREKNESYGLSCPKLGVWGLKPPAPPPARSLFVRLQQVVAGRSGNQFSFYRSHRNRVNTGRVDSSIPVSFEATWSWVTWWTRCSRLTRRGRAASQPAAWWPRTSSAPSLTGGRPWNNCRLRKWTMWWAKTRPPSPSNAKVTRLSFICEPHYCYTSLLLVEGRWPTFCEVTADQCSVSSPLTNILWSDRWPVKVMIASPKRICSPTSNFRYLLHLHKWTSLVSERNFTTICGRLLTNIFWRDRWPEFCEVTADQQSWFLPPRGVSNDLCCLKILWIVVPRNDLFWIYSNFFSTERSYHLF